VNGHLTQSDSNQELTPMSGQQLANVLSVKVTGSPQAYQFLVEISSPDKGCNQYADWWEVLSQNGDLIYRRILLHSHVDEQPFARSGGPVSIAPEAVVLVRAHMSPGGYGGSVLRGTVRDGFQPVEIAPEFASDLEHQAPQPEDCAF
jgi:hypothetical protein